MKGLREECGVVGIYGHDEAAKLAYLGLHALQHRGQEGAGICTSDGQQLRAYRGRGLVGDVFNQDNLATLLGTLKEFYRKMGFDKVRFKPDFFPYTEPSAEISVFMESKDSWIEFGGSGIFRPEVTRPLGCDVPVLAWGLGLERLAMLRYGLKDIRELYWSDIDKIKEVPLCQ